MTNNKKLHIAWWQPTSNAKTNNSDIRCLQVKQGLGQHGYKTSFWNPELPLPDVLILSKRFDEESIKTIQNLTINNNTCWILDVCDNYFDIDQNDTLQSKKRNDLIHAVKQANGVITASDTLKLVTQKFTNRDSYYISVIEDPIEPVQTKHWFKDLITRPASVLRALHYSTKTKLNCPNKQHRLVWFGNTANSLTSGSFSDLLEHQSTLEKLHNKTPIQLTIVSNDYKLFKKHVSNWKLPVSYYPWSPEDLSWVLQQNSVCLIPEKLNSVSQCKSNICLLTAINHQLVPVFEPIPSYMVFEKYFPAGMNPYNIARAIENNHKEQLADANAFAKRQFGLESILNQWEFMIKKVWYEQTH